MRVDKNYVCGKWDIKDADLFGDEEYEEIKSGDLWDIFVENGIFKSRSDCKKNSKYPKEIPSGWSDIEIGKLRHRICIWNPSEAKK